MNDSELIDTVIVKLKNGQVADAVETLLKGKKTKPCKVAVLASKVTESLIRNDDIQTLRFFVEKLDFYHTHEVKF